VAHGDRLVDGLHAIFGHNPYGGRVLFGCDGGLAGLRIVLPLGAVRDLREGVEQVVVNELLQAGRRFKVGGLILAEGVIDL